MSKKVSKSQIAKFNRVDNVIDENPMNVLYDFYQEVVKEEEEEIVIGTILHDVEAKASKDGSASPWVGFYHGKVLLPDGNNRFGCLVGSKYNFRIVGVNPKGTVAFVMPDNVQNLSQPMVVATAKIEVSEPEPKQPVNPIDVMISALAADINKNISKLAPKVDITIDLEAIQNALNTLETIDVAWKMATKKVTSAYNKAIKQTTKVIVTKATYAKVVENKGIRLQPEICERLQREAVELRKHRITLIENRDQAIYGVTLDFIDKFDDVITKMLPVLNNVVVPVPFYQEWNRIVNQ